MSTQVLVIALVIMGIISAGAMFLERKDMHPISKDSLLKYGGMTVIFFIVICLFMYSCSLVGLKSSNGLSTDLNAPLWYLFLYVAVFSPILEEFLFRFVMFKFLKFMAGPKTEPRVTEAVSIVTSAFIFGMVHQGGLVQNIYAFSMGIVFGCVYVKEKNILVTTYMHFLFNSITMVIFTVGMCLS